MFSAISVDMGGVEKLMKKHFCLVIILLIICCTAIITFNLQQNSLTLQFKKQGYDTNDIEEIYISTCNDNTEYAVCATNTAEGDPVLVLAEKNSLGFWRITKAKKIADENPFDAIALLNVSDISRFDYDSDMTQRCQWHYFYCGNDAIKSLDTLQTLMPENVAVNVRQAGSEYLIHVIAFEQTDLDVRAVLCENALVAS